MIPFNRFASTITLALTLSVGAHAQSTNLEKDVESYFLQALNTQLTTEVADRKAFTNAPTCVTHLHQKQGYSSLSRDGLEGLASS